MENGKKVNKLVAWEVKLESEDDFLFKPIEESEPDNLKDWILLSVTLYKEHLPNG